MYFLNQTLSEIFIDIAGNQYILTTCYAIFFIALFVYLYTGILLCEEPDIERKAPTDISITTTLPVNSMPATTLMYENMNWLIEIPGHYSPLNFKRNGKVNARTLETLHWENHNSLPNIMLLQNNGQNVTLEGIYPINMPIVHGANLPVSYSFVQVTFRWDSDHMLDDKKFPLEMQVSYRFNDEEPDNEISSYDTFIVSFVFDVGQYNISLRPIIDNLKHVQVPSSKIRIPIVPLSMIMPLFVGGFYCYVGSMIEHPFDEGVKWSVYSKPLTVGRDQLEEFHKLLGCDRKPIKSNGRYAKSVSL